MLDLRPRRYSWSRITITDWREVLDRCASPAACRAGRCRSRSRPAAGTRTTRSRTAAAWEQGPTRSPCATPRGQDGAERLDLLEQLRVAQCAYRGTRSRWNRGTRRRSRRAGGEHALVREQGRRTGPRPCARRGTTDGDRSWPRIIGDGRARADGFAEEAPSEGLFGRGLRLTACTSVRTPACSWRPNAGVPFAIGSIALTTALGRATDDVLEPAFSGGVSARAIWLSVLALMGFGILRAIGIMIRRFPRGVRRARKATLRTRIAEEMSARARLSPASRPHGELLAHIEADVKAAVDVFSGAVRDRGGRADRPGDDPTARRRHLPGPRRADPVPDAGPDESELREGWRAGDEPQERIGEVSAGGARVIDGALVVKTLGRERAEMDRLACVGPTLRRRARPGGLRAGDVRGRARRLPASPTRSWSRWARGGSRRRDHAGPADAASSRCSTCWRGRCASSAGSSRSCRARSSGTARLEKVFEEPVTVLPAADPVQLPAGPLALEVRTFTTSSTARASSTA